MLVTKVSTSNLASNHSFSSYTAFYPHISDLLPMNVSCYMYSSLDWKKSNCMWATYGGCVVCTTTMIPPLFSPNHHTHFFVLNGVKVTKVLALFLDYHQIFLGKTVFFFFFPCTWDEWQTILVLIKLVHSFLMPRVCPCTSVDIRCPFTTWAVLWFSEDDGDEFKMPHAYILKIQNIAFQGGKVLLFNKNERFCSFLVQLWLTGGLGRESLGITEI